MGHQQHVFAIKTRIPYVQTDYTPKRFCKIYVHAD